ncbi:hypothetical protein QUF76_08880 [Desulfobacterales bacterium HSG16]|nr:hypothetical protein [Desulfobacterales bacterium HSG16]
MLDFDLRDTAAGQGILIKARKVVIEALEIRFKDVPQEIQEFVNSIGEDKLLSKLFRYAICSPTMEDFSKTLSEVLPASNADNMPEMSA